MTATSALRRPGADTALLTTNPSSTCFEPDQGAGFPLPTTRSCFVWVSHWGEERFLASWQSCPPFGSTLCPILFIPFPRMTAHIVYSRLCPCHHTGASSLGTSLAETLWGSSSKNHPKELGVEAIVKFGSPRGSLLSMDQTVLCCVHTGEATPLPVSRTQGLGAALHTWASAVGNQSCSKENQAQH